MERQYKMDILEMLGNYGHYVCNIGAAMDKAGISISKMRRLTGLNHEIVKKYYEDRIVRILWNKSKRNNRIYPTRKKDESAKQYLKLTR